MYPIVCHPGVELRANLKSISHRCQLFEVAFVWGLTNETIHLPLGCLQGEPKQAPRYRRRFPWKGRPPSGTLFAPTSCAFRLFDQIERERERKGEREIRIQVASLPTSLLLCRHLLLHPRVFDRNTSVSWSSEVSQIEGVT